jgi:predicted nucleic acid-binding Zn ribbon protein
VDNADTAIDGAVDGAVDSAVDIAAAALADAQRIARAKPRRGTAAGRRVRRENLAGRSVTDRNRGGYSGPGRDDGVDPHLVGDVLAGYVDERGWARPLAAARVFAEWPALVGSDVAAHCAPATLRDGELRIAAESTAWATQLRLLSATLLARLVAELGPEVVTKLVITGPTAPSWRHGAFTVRGARGPRDTYG